MGVKLIRLERVRSRKPTADDPRRSYVFQANLALNGDLAIEGYSAVSRLCKVIKSGPDCGRSEGYLVLTSDGWVLSCDGGTDHRHSSDRLRSKSLTLGNYVTISEGDGEPSLFEVMSVEDAGVEMVRF